MPYVNPLYLLDISTLDPTTVRKAKQQQLAMLQLSEEGTLAYGSLSVDRATLLQVCDELRQERLAQYHYALYQEAHLLQFLSFGQTDYFTQPQPDLWGDPAFRRFVGPFFVEQFDQGYAQAFAVRDVMLLQQMVADELLVPQRDVGLCFRSTKRKAEVEYDRLKKLEARLPYARPDRKLTTGADFKALLYELALPAAWQVLPNSFASLRAQVVRSYANLLQQMQKRYGVADPSFLEVLEAVEALPAPTAVKQQLASLNRDAKRTQKTSQQRKWADKGRQVLQTVDQLLFMCQSGQMKMEAVHKGLLDVCDDEALESLKLAERERLSHKLRTLCALMWERREDLSPILDILSIACRMGHGLKSKPYCYFSTSVEAPSIEPIAAQAQAATLMLETLRKLSVKNLRFEHGKLHLLAWMRLIEALFTADVQQWIMRKGTFTLLAWVHSELFPLLHFFRKVDGTATLHLLTALHPILHDDNVVSEKTAQLRRLITGKEASTQHTIEEEALVPTGFWTSLQHMVARFQDGHWLSAVVAVVLAVAIVGCGLSLVFVEPQVIHEDPEFAPPPITEEEREKIIWQTQLDSFAGNQLDNNALAFPLCFGPGVTSNQGGTLHLTNQTGEDMVACVYWPDSFIMRHAYVQSGATIRFTQLGQDTLRLKLYTGSDWHPNRPNGCGTHGSLMTRPQYWRLRQKLTPSLLANGIYMRIGGPNMKVFFNSRSASFNEAFYSISANAYYQVKPDWKRRRDGET